VAKFTNDLEIKINNSAYITMWRALKEALFFKIFTKRFSNLGKILANLTVTEDT